MTNIVTGCHPTLPKLGFGLDVDDLIWMFRRDAIEVKGLEQTQDSNDGHVQTFKRALPARHGFIMHR